MQRGRARGQNPNLARSTSTRGSRSTSRGIISRSNSRAAPRRSARLAQLVNGDSGLHTEDNSMADVARRRTQTADRLGNRAVGHRAGAARHSSSQPQRVNGSRQQATYQSTDPNEIRYSMDILVQPPATAVSGYTLQPGLTVRLRSLSGDLNDAIYDSSNLVAVATLTSSHTPLADADLNTILAGRRYNSIHPFDEDTEVSLGSSDPRGVGYVSFPDLSIRREGTYRIRITLIRIRSSSGEPPMSPASGATTVQVIESNPITVRGNGSTSASAAMQQEDGEDDDGGWLEVLRTIRTRRRSPL